MQEKIFRIAKIYFIKLNSLFFVGGQFNEKMNVTINGHFKKILLKAKYNNLICIQKTK